MENDASFAVAKVPDMSPELQPTTSLRAQVFLEGADPIFIEDLHGHIIDMNAEAELAYGWSRDELLGQSITMIVPPERHGQADELRQRCRAGKQVRNVEGLRVTKDHRVHQVLITLSLLHDAAGQPVALASLTKDMTRREQTLLAERLDAELKGMERLYTFTTTLMRHRDLAGYLDAILDAALNVSQADKGTIQLYDGATGTLRIIAQYGFTDTFLKFFSQVRQDHVATCGAALQSGERVIVEDVTHSPLFRDTVARDILLAAGVRAVQSTPLVDHTGHLVGILSTHYAVPYWPSLQELRFIDILAHQAANEITRVQAEEALRASEERFHTLADNIAQFAWMADKTGWIFWYNKRWFEYTGTTLEEMAGWGWQKVHHPDHVDRVVDRIQHSWETGELWEDVFPLRGKDGTYRWFLSRALPIRDAHGAIVRWFGTNTDVTEQRQAEEELQQAYASLEQRVAERTAELRQAHDDLRQQMVEHQRMQEALFQQEKLAALGTLLANVAHELNNPLAVATMQLDSLQEEWGCGPWRDDLETLRQAITRCGSVVQSFLGLARQQPPTRSAVALPAIIQEALTLQEHSLRVDNITLHLDLAENLPELWADPHQLYHVVTNLITNAQHALRQAVASRDLRITTAIDTERTQVILQVEDSGPGIPEDLQRRIFEPFFTTKAAKLGSGLGLPLCRNIVEGHGGTIQVTSQAGHGTTFCVTLPITVPPSSASPQSPVSVESTQAQHGTILLIDDEVGLAQALQRLLRRSGHEITTATNGYEGLAALAAHSYDVILCDMRMPDLDGPGFYRELERCYPHLLSRVIFLTGDVLSAEAREFFAQVKRPHLIKPFKAKEVRQAIQQALAEHARLC